MKKTYYVTLIGEKTDDECILLKTTDIEEAKKRAKEEVYYIKRDKRKGNRIEIRLYRFDIENEYCECFDYDTINF